MPSKLMSASVVGLDAEPVEVEVDLTLRPNPRFYIVGLPDAAVSESKYRVLSAIRNTVGSFKYGKITTNLAPADLKKEGPGFDLPIALGVLHVLGHCELVMSDSLFVGELSLDGRLRHTNGVLPIAIMARTKGYKKLFVPEVNAREASLIKDVEVYSVKNLREFLEHVAGGKKIKPCESGSLQVLSKREDCFENDMAYVKGQEHVKRALEIAAAGGHNMLMSGPPGSGKTMLARTIPSILPQMDLDESLEITKIHSIAGMLKSDEPLIGARPFRAPHHTASGVALVGGGTWPKPGEISLAHRGVLFLDEFPEFPRQVLENLRQPLEDGVVTISRASGTLTFPAKFILIASMNPCPCGYAGDPERECTCSPLQVASYQKRISGPLMDRIDMHVEVPKVDINELTTEKLSESSEIIRERVQKARDRQVENFRKTNFKNVKTNSEMTAEQIRKFCKIDHKTSLLLKKAVTQMNLSARSYHRILKLARTIADLAHESDIKMEYVAEALQYRASE